MAARALSQKCLGFAFGRADLTNKVIMLKKYTFIILFIAFSKTSNLVAQTQMEMNQTGFNDFNKADDELNIIYKKVMKF